jgi:hypothetical protein
MTRTSFTVVAALAFTCWLSAHAQRTHAQIGPGWKEITPPSDIQVEGHDKIKSFPGDTREAVNASGRYTNAHGVETFEIEDRTANRVERHYRDDFHSGTRQFEAEVTIFAPTNDECIHQIFSDQPHHPWLLLRTEAADGGSLKVALHDGAGSRIIATGLHGKPFRLNTIDDADTGEVRIYIDGKLKWTGKQPRGTYFHKYGAYGTLGAASAKVQFRNVKMFEGGRPE